uniref:Putative inhibition of apoptosis protein 3 n=1 Tax=Macrobrachium nudivirus CN-SL2011 TaxID=1217568 RepID=I7FNV7_9VIRU|nr:putative inhibition of apoptosis protein 3 [Macrobrachium nudivirus CN-SL2011]
MMDDEIYETSSDYEELIPDWLHSEAEHYNKHRGEKENITFSIEENEYYSAEMVLALYDRYTKQLKPTSIYRFMYLCDFYDEELRRNTFENWAYQDIVDKDELARSGFVNTHKRDCVFCVFCKEELKDWQVGDDVELEHSLRSPMCSHNRELLNIPVHFKCVELPYNLNETLRVYLYHKRDLATVLMNYPEYNDSLNRSLTFKTHDSWPIEESTLSQKKLVDAGFFYTGVSDFIMCHSCGLGLFNLQSNDIFMKNPIQTHSAYSPFCPYLSQKMLQYSRYRKLPIVLPPQLAHLPESTPENLPKSIWPVGKPRDYFSRTNRTSNYLTRTEIRTFKSEYPFFQKLMKEYKGPAMKQLIVFLLQSFNFIGRDRETMIYLYDGLVQCGQIGTHEGHGPILLKHRKKKELRKLLRERIMLLDFNICK